MTQASQKEKLESGINYIDIPEEIVPYYEVEDAIWHITDLNLKDSIAKIIEILTINPSMVVFALNCIDFVATKRQKFLKEILAAFQEISQKMQPFPQQSHKHIDRIINSEDKSIFDIYPPNSPFYFACWDKVDELQALTSNMNFEFDQIDQSGNTLLDVAASYNSLNCFKFLLMNDVKIQPSTSKKAIEGGNPEIIHILEQKGSVFNNFVGVAIENHHNAIADWLLEQYKSEKMSVAKCLAFFNIKAFLFYLMNGYNPNIEYWVSTAESFRKNSIVLASENNAIEIMKLLMKYKHDVNADSEEMIITYRKYEILGYIIEKQDQEKSVVNTPLTIACNYGFIEIIKILLENGADVNIPKSYTATVYTEKSTETSQGSKNPIEIAEENGFMEIVKLLQDHRSDPK